ncbi:transmembrane protein, putative [Medicago truncatula]|uniref:Transmembrane protein, putative n=1 Tax=Medicago truncatula TaxID=3880 RepID=G7KUM0_MEDTR|nr:transmembrane protein, putative [Medicago truncatula]
MENLSNKRIWCSGIIVPSHGTDQGSIPWMRKNFGFYISITYYLNIEISLNTFVICL